jgi:hypothetical protein
MAFDGMSVATSRLFKKFLPALKSVALMDSLSESYYPDVFLLTFGLMSDVVVL